MGSPIMKGFAGHFKDYGFFTLRCRAIRAMT